jgi:hypothetical protein
MTSLCRKGTSWFLVHLHKIKTKKMNNCDEMLFKSFVLHDDILCCLVVTWRLPKEVSTWFQQALT